MEDIEMNRTVVRAAVVGLLVVLSALPVAAQAKVAVIDVQRVVTESDPGKEVMQRLKTLTDSKAQRGQVLQQELAALQDQFNKQRFAVSEARQAEMSKEIEDKQIAIRRFQDDAQREVSDAQRRELGSL
jgi:outer membrane protein